MDAIPDGTHVVIGEEVAPGQHRATMHLPNGRRQEVVTKDADPNWTPPRSGSVLERCPDARGEGRVWHKANGTPRRGPPRVHSQAYCEGYERTFGHSGPRASNPPRRDKLN